MKKYQLFATAAAGIEGLVADELRDLGYQVQTQNGRVHFEGTMQDIARCNLWLRTADRVKINFGTFKATDFDTLYEETYALPWEELIPMDGAFPVRGRSIRSQLSSVPQSQRVVKRAIAKRIMDHYHRRMNLPETGEVYPLEVEIRKNQVTLTVDTSGESLFKRGYRVDKGEAPLRENMAAALIMLTTWFPDRPFYDPTTGSGTLPIEAAMMGMKIAPGLNRSFAAESWTFFDANLWKEERQAALAAIDHEIELDILACDIDHRMIEIAKENALEAGVLDQIEFKQMQVADYVPEKTHGILVANPPYGERLNDRDYVHKLYRQMGQIYQPMTTWSKYILTSDENFEEYYGQAATRKRKLYNGATRVDYYQYWSQD